MFPLDFIHLSYVNVEDALQTASPKSTEKHLLCSDWLERIAVSPELLWCFQRTWFY